MVRGQKTMQKKEKKLNSVDIISIKYPLQPMTFKVFEAIYAMSAVYKINNEKKKES